MASINTPVFKGKNVRVWIAPKGLLPLETKFLESCILPGAVAQDKNTETIIRTCPSPNSWTLFDEVQRTTVSSDGDITTDLSARVSVDQRSLLRHLHKEDCEFDMMWVYGKCGDPNDIYTYTRVEYFLGSRVTSYSHDTVGAFSQDSAGDDVIETVSLIVGEFHELARLDYRVTLAGDVDNHYLEPVILSDKTCAGDSDCDGVVYRDDGCQIIVAPYVDLNLSQYRYMLSKDGGVTWADFFVHTGVGGFDERFEIAKAGKHMIAVDASQDAEYWYITYDEFINDPTPTWTAFNGPEDADAGYTVFVTNFTIWVAGDLRQLHQMDSRDIGVSGLSPVPGDLGALTNYYKIHGIDENFIVVVGEGNKITVVENGVARDVIGPNVLPIPPFGIKCVWVFDKSHWFIGTGPGSLWYTEDGGNTWVLNIEVEATGIISSIHFPNRAVGYFVYDRTGTFKLYRTICGGQAWRETKVTTGTSQTTYGIDSCDDGNFIIYNDGTSVMVGEDALRRYLS